MPPRRLPALPGKRVESAAAKAAAACDAAAAATAEAESGLATGPGGAPRRSRRSPLVEAPPLTGAGAGAVPGDGALRSRRVSFHAHEGGSGDAEGDAGAEVLVL